MTIFGIGYMIGFFVYLVTFATETYNELDENAGARIFTTLLIVVSIGIFYSTVWPIIWLLEQNNKKNKENKTTAEEVKNNER